MKPQKESRVGPQAHPFNRLDEVGDPWRSSLSAVDHLW